MESYEVFAPFYDAVMGDRAEHADYLRSLIEKHHPKAKTLLELAFGTGSVLKRRPRRQRDPQCRFEITTALEGLRQKVEAR